MLGSSFGAEADKNKYYTEIKTYGWWITFATTSVLIAAGKK